MKRVFTIMALFLCMSLIFGLAACANNGGNNPPNNAPPNENQVESAENFEVTSKILVVYFSKTNTTKAVAQQIQQFTGADIFEIERKEPYPDDYTPTTQVAKEEKDANARPELREYLPKYVLEQYDYIFIGFPIWWHTAPMPVLSFLNFYDWTEKTIYTFCTAASSPITESTADIRSNAKGANVIEGKKFLRNDSGIQSWINSLNLPT